MSSLDTPTPPLCPLSTNATELVKPTNHVLPNSTEALKGILDGNTQSGDDTYRVYDTFMWAPSYS